MYARVVDDIENAAVQRYAKKCPAVALSHDKLGFAVANHSVNLAPLLLVQGDSVPLLGAPLDVLLNVASSFRLSRYHPIPCNICAALSAKQANPNPRHAHMTTAQTMNTYTSNFEADWL
jgi:hypothetical protein